MTKRLVQSILLAVGLGLAFFSGCSPHEKRCEEVCLQFVNDCGWTAWENLAQCQVGCVDDTYRRDDANELLDCYSSAAAVPSLEEAAAAVERAVEAGFFSVEQASGTFDREAATTLAVEQGTCDAFALVQCRADAVKRRPTGAFIQP